MTQKALSDNNRRSPLVTPRYMLGTAKRGWAIAVLFFIVFLFFFTLQAVTELSGFWRINFAREQRIRELLSYIYALRGTFVVLSSFAAVWSGCHFLSFMHNKTSAGFFHSLPERRSGHFITAIFASLASFAVGAVSNYVFVILLFAANGCIYAEIALPLFTIVLWGLFYFAVFLSITMLAGVISGNPAIHTIMTGVLIFILPALYLSGMILLNYGSNYLDTGSMMFDIETHKWLSPVFRAVYVLADSDSLVTPAWVVVALDILLTAAFFALAYYAYTKRPIERSGSPIIYGWLSETVKYVLMFPAAVFMSTIFNGIFGYNGSGWGVFGFLAGLLLAYMLCNTILNRTAKAMFSHVRGFIIYSVAVSVASIILISGCFGIFEYAVPNATRLSLTIDGEDVTLTDRDEIKLVRGAIKEYVSALRRGEADAENIGYAYEYYDPDYGYGYYEEKYDYESTEYFQSYASGADRTARLWVRYQTPFGFGLSYDYGRIPYKYAAQIVDALTQCDSFLESLSPNSAYISGLSFYFNASSSHLISDDTYTYDQQLSLDSLRGRFTDVSASLYTSYNDKLGLEEFADAFNNILTPKDAGFFQRYAIGHFNTEYPEVYYYYDSSYEYYSSYYSGTLYFDDLKAICAALGGSFKYDTGFYADTLFSYITSSGTGLGTILALSEDEYFDGIAGTIDEIAVYNKSTGKTTYYRGDDVRAILPHLAAIDKDDISMLTKTDDNYVVRVKVKDFHGQYGYYDYYEDVDVSYSKDEYHEYPLEDAYSYYVTWFLANEVPEIVK